MGKNYVPADYWARLHDRDDLSAVGQSALPAAFNSWLYRNGARNLRRFLSKRLRKAPATVYDAGAGTGYWVDFWMNRGARVDGSDLVETAVRRLAKRFAGEFDVLDITAGAPQRTYELVSCMNVLLHVLDDTAFERALSNLAGAVAPGGYLLLAEPIARTEAVGHQSRVRSINRYTEPLGRVGLRLRAIGGTSVIGADPIETSHRLYPVWKFIWRLNSWVARRSQATAVLAGAVIYVLDPGLLAMGFSPSGKFALFQREPVS